MLLFRGGEQRSIPGRITGYLNEQNSPGPALKYYLCGGAETVVETRDMLSHRIIFFNQIISEIYF